MSTHTQRNKSACRAVRSPLKLRIGRRTAANTETIRGYIPLSIEPSDRPLEIVDVFGVSYGTACVWLRILRGPMKRN
jgi:hypothetical protein